MKPKRYYYYGHILGKLIRLNEDEPAQEVKSGKVYDPCPLKWSSCQKIFLAKLYRNIFADDTIEGCATEGAQLNSCYS